LELGSFVVRIKGARSSIGDAGRMAQHMMQHCAQETGEGDGAFPGESWQQASGAFAHSAGAGIVHANPSDVMAIRAMARTIVNSRFIGCA